MYELCSLNAGIDMFAQTIQMQHPCCKSLRRALQTSERLSNSSDLFTQLAQLITRSADPNWNSTQSKRILSHSLRDIWEAFNDVESRNADATEYAAVHALLVRFQFDHVAKSKTIPETLAVVQEVLRVDGLVRDTISQHFTNTVRAQIFVPFRSKYPVLQVDSIDVSFFELLGHFIGKDPDLICLGKNIKKKADPTRYTLPHVIQNAFVAGSTRVKKRVYDMYCEELGLDTKSHRIEVTIDKLSRLHSCSMDWHSKETRAQQPIKFKRKLHGDAPVLLLHGDKQFPAGAAAGPVVTRRSWLLSPIQEVMHSGVHRNKSHFTWRAPSLNKTHLTCTDGQDRHKIVKQRQLYTKTEAEEQRWHVANIVFFAIELPPVTDNYVQCVAAYGVRVEQLRTLNDSALFIEHQPPPFIEYTSKAVTGKFLNRGSLNVCQ